MCNAAAAGLAPAATGSAALETGCLRSARASSVESCTAIQWFFVMVRTGWTFHLYMPFKRLPNVLAGKGLAGGGKPEMLTVDIACRES
jgi:hypothetical protein